jgi:PAS domain S-box-containing protein
MLNTEFLRECCRDEESYRKLLDYLGTWSNSSSPIPEEVWPRIPVFIYVFDLQQRKTISYSRTLTSMGGFSGPEMFIQAITHPDDLLRLNEYFERIAQAPIGRDEFTLEFRIRNSREEWIYLRDQSRIINRDEHGKPLLMAGCITDTTALLQSHDREYRRTLARLQALVEQFPNGSVAIFDQDLHVVMMYGQGFRLLGLSPDHYIGKSFYETADKDFLDKVLPYYEAAFRGIPGTYEAPFREFQYFASVTPLYEADGSIQQILVITQNITEIKKAHQELMRLNTTLQQINEEKDELLAIVAHDLKNPLYSLRSALNILHRLSEQEKDIVFTSLRESVDTMLALIMRLLDANRLDKGMLTAHISQVDLNSAVYMVIAQYQEQAGNKSIQIDCTLPEHSLVKADLQLLQQAIANLVSNAVKYTPPGGNIKVEGTIQDQNLIMYITDTGPGFTAEDRNKIFRKFARLSARPTAGEHSTGLGLSIVSKLLELMNCSINLISPPGQGASFQIIIPLAIQAENE